MQDDREPALSGYRLALAVLPGAIVIGDRLGLWHRLSPFDRTVPYLLAATLFIGLAGYAAWRRFPVWSFPALGLVVSYIGLFPALIFLAIDPPAPSSGPSSGGGGLPGLLVALAFLSVPAVALGSLFARRHGLVAGLVVASSISAVCDAAVVPGPGWGGVLGPLLLLIVAPILVTRLRSGWARAAGLLVPVVLAVAPKIKGFYQLGAYRVVWDLVTFSLLPMAAAVAIYAWLGSRPGRAAQAGS